MQSNREKQQYWDIPDLESKLCASPLVLLPIWMKNPAYYLHICSVPVLDDERDSWSDIAHVSLDALTFLPHRYNGILPVRINDGRNTFYITKGDLFYEFHVRANPGYELLKRKLFGKMQLMREELLQFCYMEVKREYVNMTQYQIDIMKKIGNVPLVGNVSSLVRVFGHFGLPFWDANNLPFGLSEFYRDEIQRYVRIHQGTRETQLNDLRTTAFTPDTFISLHEERKKRMEEKRNRV